MKKIKVLNLYAGIGGNRKLWKNVEVTAIEKRIEIAKIYKKFFPQDRVACGDAHKYLLKHFKEYDFIWASPPCPTHSKLVRSYGNNNKCNALRYPDMKLYEEIILLKYFFKGKYVIENVITYYDPLIKPYKVGNHYFWSNFYIPKLPKIKREWNREHNGGIERLQKFKGFNLEKFKFSSKYPKEKVLRNCVKPELGLYIFNQAFKNKQEGLLNYTPTPSFPLETKND